MNKKRWNTLLIAFAVLLLPVFLSGCENLQLSSPSSSSQAAPNSDVSSEPAPTVEPTLEPTPEPSAVSSAVSELEKPAADFDQVFDGNSLDAALEDELAEASSSHAILQAYENAESRWKSFIQLTYNNGKSQLSGEDLERFQQEQESWEESIDIVVEGIRADAGDDSDGKLTAARMIQERYREWGKSLAQVIYDATGELPDFEKALSGEAMG